MNRDRPTGLINHPVVLICIGLLVLNDHVWKMQFHNSVTGKLSDVAGLVVFPVVFVSLTEVGFWLACRPLPSRANSLVAASVLCGVGFTLVQTVPFFTDLYAVVAAQLYTLATNPLGYSWQSKPASVTADITDLATLPAVVVPWLLDRYQLLSRPYSLVPAKANLT